MKILTFKPLPFFLLNVLAGLIFFSWAHDSTRLYWDELDYQALDFLNGWLSQTPSLWNQLWVVLSIRVADVLPLIFMLGFFYFDDVLFKKDQRLAGFIGFIVLLVLMFIVREGLDFYVEYNHLSRISPSLQLDFVVRLSELYPEFNLKDASVESFPGDHATVLMTWLGYCLFFMRNRWSWMALLLVVIFSLPRLVSGAHWLSDVLVGGSSIALLSLAFGLYTPLLNRINQIGMEWASYFLQLFGRILTKKQS